MIKSATVSARIDEKVKNEAEEILQQLGIPVSVVINALYHQIIIQKGIPFPIKLDSRPLSLEDMTAEQFNARLQHSYEQAMNREGTPLEEVFRKHER